MSRIDRLQKMKKAKLITVKSRTEVKLLNAALQDNLAREVLDL